MLILKPIRIYYLENNPNQYVMLFKKISFPIGNGLRLIGQYFSLSALVPQVNIVRQLKTQFS